MGRVVLWCVVAVLLLRGAADLLRADRSAPLAREPQAAANTWPDDAAKAYAVDFARAYLSYSPRQREEYRRRLEAFVGPELLASMAPENDEDAAPQVVQAATVPTAPPWMCGMRWSRSRPRRRRMGRGRGIWRCRSGVIAMAV